ncbi:MAG: glycosyltransferase family 2 protein [Bacteroidetes bacterium]|nr:glycosyltransferase family 2 protein [Bacteroidota bacterium]
MDCSIIIVTWNSGLYIETCLQSIYETIKKHKFEVIVLDNASTDNTCTILSVLEKKYNNLHVIINSENSGFAKANNKGLQYARGKYILFLNPDTKVLENAIDEMLIYLENNANVGIVGPQLFYSDDALQMSAFNIQSFFSLVVEHLISSSFLKAIEVKKRKVSKPIEVDVVRGACLLIRRNVIEKLGGLNENLFLFSEETDLSVRTKRIGYRVMFLPDLKVYHYEGKSSELQKKDFILFHYLKSKIIFYRLYYSTAYARLVEKIILLGCYLRILHAIITNNKPRAQLFKNVYFPLVKFVQESKLQ